MAVALLEKNPVTQYCEFTYDNWSTDGHKLPGLNNAGKDNLSTIKLCSQGSIAIGTDGSLKMLNGNNKWVDFLKGD